MVGPAAGVQPRIWRSFSIFQLFLFLPTERSARSEDQVVIFATVEA
jgi:hypothetical protein